MCPKGSEVWGSSEVLWCGMVIQVGNRVVSSGDSGHDQYGCVTITTQAVCMMVNLEFPNEKMWFPIVMLVYQMVIVSYPFFSTIYQCVEIIELTLNRGNFHCYSVNFSGLLYRIQNYCFSWWNKFPLWNKFITKAVCCWTSRHTERLLLTARSGDLHVPTMSDLKGRTWDAKTRVPLCPTNYYWFNTSFWLIRFAFHCRDCRVNRTLCQWTSPHVCWYPIQPPFQAVTSQFLVG